MLAGDLLKVGVGALVLLAICASHVSCGSDSDHLWKDAEPTGVTRVEVGAWTMTFFREEFADHGRPYGGRVGGEIGHQRPQPERPQRRRHEADHEEST